MRQQRALRDKRSSETMWKRREKTRRERPRKSRRAAELPFVFFVLPLALFSRFVLSLSLVLLCIAHYAPFSGHVCLFAEPTNLRFGRDFTETSKRIETRELSTRSKERDNVLELLYVLLMKHSIQQSKEKSDNALKI